MAEKVHTWNQSDIERHLKSAVSQMTPDIWDRFDLSVPQEKGCGEIHAASRKEKKGIRIRRRLQGLAAAACLCAVLGSGMYYREFRQIVTVIALDVNPSLELYLNRRDTVIKTVAKNDDGETVADQADVTGRKLSDAVEAVVTAMAQDGYLEQNQEKKSAVLVTVSSKQNEKKTEELKQNVTADVEYSLAVNEVPAVVYGQLEADRQVSQEVQKLADEYQISQGKAAFIQGLAAENENLQEEDVSKLAQMNMSEISNQIEENSYQLGSQVQVTSVTAETITKVRVIRSASGTEDDSDSGRISAKSAEPQTYQEEAAVRETQETAIDRAVLSESEPPAAEESENEPELEMSLEGIETETMADEAEESGLLKELEMEESADWTETSEALNIAESLEESWESCLETETAESQEMTEQAEGLEPEKEAEERETEESLEKAEPEMAAEDLEETETEESAEDPTGAEESTESETETEESSEAADASECTKAPQDTDGQESAGASADEETEESTEPADETETAASAEETVPPESTAESEEQPETKCTSEEGQDCMAEEAESEAENTDKMSTINKSSLRPAEEQYGPGMEEAIWESEWLDKENQAGQWLYGPGVTVTGDPLRVDTIYNSSDGQFRIGAQRQWIGSISERTRSRWYFQLGEAFDADKS